MQNLIYLLYYDYDDDESRETWSVFYTQCEAFSTAEKRKTRQVELKKKDPGLSFHKVEIDID